MDPVSKLSYFEAQEWPWEWINTACEIAQTQWHQHYWHNSSTSLSTPSSSQVLFESTTTDDDNEYGGIVIPSLHHQHTPIKDAFEVYIQAPPLPLVMDPLIYWVVIGASNPPDDL